MKENKKGMALVALIFIMLAFAALVIGVLFLLVAGNRKTVDEYNYEKAFYIAEAGRNYGVKKLYNIVDWTQELGFPIIRSFGGGVFNVSVENPTETSIMLYSTGVITSEGKTYSRKVRTALTKDVWGFVNDFVIYWEGSGGLGGGGVTQMNNNVMINGDMLTNSSVNFASGAGVDGNAYAAGTITGGIITGVREQYTTLPIDPPTLITTYYDGLISTAAGHAAGDQTWNSRSISGTTYINGDLVISNSSNISTSGPTTVVVTGTITVNNNVTIDDDLMLISSGLMTMNNSTTIGNRCTLFSTAGFSIKNNLTAASFSAGQGTSFLTPGDFASFWNNATIYGFIYVGGTLALNNNTNFYGTIVADQITSIGNNSVLSANPGSINYGGIHGIDGGTSTRISTWEEVF